MCYLQKCISDGHYRVALLEVCRECRTASFYSPDLGVEVTYFDLDRRTTDAWLRTSVVASETSLYFAWAFLDLERVAAFLARPHFENQKK